MKSPGTDAPDSGSLSFTTNLETRSSLWTPASCRSSGFPLPSRPPPHSEQASTQALIEWDLGHGITARGSYTYLDAVVQRSFASSALSPAFNPNFPTIPIGTSTPLVGGRPFRRAPHSGDFLIGFIRPSFTLSLNGTLVGRRDDSTHLTDPFFGNTMLLPNRNLDAAYQKIDLNGSLRINSGVELYTSLENILNQHYDAAFGFPSLPFTFRAGMKLTLGGESWKIH